MTARIRVKIPTWDQVTGTPTISCVSITSMSGAPLMVIPSNGSMDIVDALILAKHITSASIPITNLGIYGINTRLPEFCVDTVINPSYIAANDLGLCFNFTGNNYYLSLSNNAMDCF